MWLSCYDFLILLTVPKQRTSQCIASVCLYVLCLAVLRNWANCRMVCSFAYAQPRPELPGHRSITQFDFSLQSVAMSELHTYPYHLQWHPTAEALGWAHLVGSSWLQGVYKISPLLPAFVAIKEPSVNELHYFAMWLFGHSQLFMFLLSEWPECSLETILISLLSVMFLRRMFIVEFPFELSRAKLLCSRG